MKLVEIFEKVPDFRTSCYVSHKLSEILVMSLCAVLSGADDFEEIREYCEQKHEFLLGFLDLENGIPSVDTFSRVFRNMDKAAFGNCLRKWSREIIANLENLQVNIDGKVLRATGKRGKKTAGQCLVSAWVSDCLVSLGQVKVSDKSNEKTAIPELIESIDVEGCLVSVDAMGSHDYIANLVRENKGDYLLALKKNNKGLHEEVSDSFSKHKDLMDRFVEVDYVGGRIETRTTFVNHDLKFIDELKGWKDSSSIIMVESHRAFKNGMEKDTSRQRFYVSSAKGNAEYFGKRIRRHWSIENQCHWFLDVVFNEDRQRVREGNGAENMATLRKMALQTLLQHKGKDSLKKVRKRVAWNEEFLLKVLQNF